MEVLRRQGIELWHGVRARHFLTKASRSSGFTRWTGPLALALALSCLAVSEVYAADETNPGGSLPKGDLVPPTVYTMSPTGVSLADGSVIFSNTDLEIGTLKLERSYSGTSGIFRDPADQFYGLRQSNNFDIYVNPMFSKFPADVLLGSAFARTTVHMGTSGSGEFFQWSNELGPNSDPNTSGTQRQTDDMKAQRLWKEDFNYRYQDESGTIYYFDKTKQVAGITGAQTYVEYAQRISSIRYPDGRVRTFQYTGTSANPKLKVVTDSTGYAIVFDWNATGQISAACGFKLSETAVSTATTCVGAALKVSYNYIAIAPTWTGRTRYVLTSFKDVLGKVTTYQFSPQGYVTCIMPPSYFVCKIQNNYLSDTQLIQTTADGGQWHYTWGTEGIEPRDNGSDAPLADNWGSYTGPNGTGSSFHFWGTTPTYSHDAAGNETRYAYTGGEKYSDQVINQGATDEIYGKTLMSVTHPEGNRYDAEYAPTWGQLIKETWTPKPTPGSTDVPLVKNYAYDQSDPINRFHPTAVQDPKGNWTNYTYATHGGVLTEMGPAPVPNGARPLKLMTWVQRNAWVKGAGGNLVQVADPVWVRQSETQCQTIAGANPAATCDPAAPQVVTTYEYGANQSGQSLLVKGVSVAADGQILRTCFGHDKYDRKISETQPLGVAGTSCP